ncbi:hypothetical protein BX661DRAFT_182573 [Kickxella alabastrina]|uniref:uncharacterized protein n=1 Tax=Kickxella alabastrina TaxID=61397 RepID=UPI00221E6B89|nr:uncharacterized protein BX661DRAFT_182573 [Kickxella alabastrina]KAI7827836.1 hypothetical protein BX661DRAFT_182573 [Kickxella alabastrina]
MRMGHRRCRYPSYERQNATSRRGSNERRSRSPTRTGYNSRNSRSFSRSEDRDCGHYASRQPSFEYHGRNQAANYRGRERDADFSIRNEDTSLSFRNNRSYSYGRGHDDEVDDYPVGYDHSFRGRGGRGGARGWIRGGRGGTRGLAIVGRGRGRGNSRGLAIRPWPRNMYSRSRSGSRGSGANETWSSAYPNDLNYDNDADYDDAASEARESSVWRTDSRHSRDDSRAGSIDRRSSLGLDHHRKDTSHSTAGYREINNYREATDSNSIKISSSRHRGGPALASAQPQEYQPPAMDESCTSTLVSKFGRFKGVIPFAQMDDCVRRTLFLRAPHDSPVSASDLRDWFSAFGEIADVLCLINRTGIGYVMFYDSRCAQQALKQAGEQIIINGASIDVQSSRPRPDALGRAPQKTDYQGTVLFSLVGSQAGIKESDRAIFEKIGDICAFYPYQNDPSQWVVEYFDCRAAFEAGRPKAPPPPGPRNGHRAPSADNLRARKDMQHHSAAWKMLLGDMGQQQQNQENQEKPFDRLHNRSLEPTQAGVVTASSISALSTLSLASPAMKKRATAARWIGELDDDNMDKYVDSAITASKSSGASGGSLDIMTRLALDPSLIQKAQAAKELLQQHQYLLGLGMDTPADKNRQLVPPNLATTLENSMQVAGNGSFNSTADLAFSTEPAHGFARNDSRETVVGDNEVSALVPTAAAVSVDVHALNAAAASASAAVAAAAAESAAVNMNSLLSLAVVEGFHSPVTAVQQDQHWQQSQMQLPKSQAPFANVETNSNADDINRLLGILAQVQKSSSAPSSGSVPAPVTAPAAVTDVKK